jgi:hypothetical protein
VLLLGDQHFIEPCEAICANLMFKLAGDFMLGLVAQFYGDNLARPFTNAMGDIVSGDVENLAVIGDAAHQDMRMGMAGVVMIDRDPIELGRQIDFHLLHQIAGRLADVGKLNAFLGGDDEEELVAILAAPIKKGWPPKSKAANRETHLPRNSESECAYSWAMSGSKCRATFEPWRYGWASNS